MLFDDKWAVLPKKSAKYQLDCEFMVDILCGACYITNQKTRNQLEIQYSYKVYDGEYGGNLSSEAVVKRRSQILSMLKEKKVLAVGEIHRKLTVSAESIRKDLMAMEAQGVLKRRHGYVELLASDVEQALDIRALDHVVQKEQIAAAALDLVTKLKVDVVGIDSGTTTACLAALLSKQRPQTVVTNSMRIANCFSETGFIHEVYCTGGIMRQMDMALYGPWTLHALRSVRMSVSFLGSNGVRNWNGVGAVSYEDAEVKRAFVQNSTKAVALLDSSKFSADTLLEAVPWESLYAVITDEGLLPADGERIKRFTRLVIA